MIGAVIFLAAMTVALSFSIGVVAVRYGPDVSNRFLEKYPQYDAAFLIDWINQDSTRARGYVFPVLFPLDFIYLLSLGGFLGLGSMIAAHSMRWPAYADWLLLLAPMLYVACDFVEDVMLSRFLLSPEGVRDKVITGKAVKFAKATTKAKIAACFAAILQTIIVSALGALS